MAAVELSMGIAGTADIAAGTAACMEDMAGLAAADTAVRKAADSVEPVAARHRRAIQVVMWYCSYAQG